jgi:predicted 3-demethylubiquinone-9 3-methyltransferase (glyoxalase superfamily)
MEPKNIICLWFDKDAHAAARFYAATFPDSKVTAVHHAPSDYPGGKKGDVLTVEFTVAGIPCLGLNGDSSIKHTEAFSFQIATDNQEETDRYWNAIIANGGAESRCLRSHDANEKNRHRRHRSRPPKLTPTRTRGVV